MFLISFATQNIGNINGEYQKYKKCWMSILHVSNYSQYLLALFNFDAYTAINSISHKNILIEI